MSDSEKSIVRRVLSRFEQDILYGRNPSRFDLHVRHASSSNLASTTGTPTPEELQNYAEYGVLVIEADDTVNPGNYIASSDCGAIKCHPIDEVKLKDKLREINQKQKDTKPDSYPLRYDAWLVAEREKTAKKDRKYSAFDQHRLHCERCKQAYEFWCDEGYSLIRG